MVGPRPNPPGSFGDMLRRNGFNSEVDPSMERNPELQTLNDIIRAGKAFNQERDYRASPNHRPRNRIDMYNVAKAYKDRAPTMDRDMDDRRKMSDLQPGDGISNIAEHVPADRRNDEPDLTDIPPEILARPKLKYLWLSGQGRLSPRRQKMVDKAMQDGKMKLKPEDWAVLESFMPLSAVKDFDKDRTEALTKVKPGSDDAYLKGLVNDAYRKREVDRVMDGIRTTAVGLGAVFGGLFGSAMGPGGTIAGGGLGAAGGSSFIDGVENATLMVLERVFPNNPVEKKFTTTDIARRAAGEGLIDMATAGAGVYAPFLAKKAKQKILGITPDSVAMQTAAKKLGIDMLPLQVGRPILGAATNVMARIPMIGTPIRKRMIEQNAKIASFTDSLPGRVGAVKFQTDQDVGVFLDFKSQQMFEKNMKDLGDRQLKIKQAARKQGDFIRMDEVAGTAQRWLDHYSQSDFATTNKNVIKKLQRIVDVAKNGKIGIDKWDDDLMAGLRNSIDELDGKEGTKAMLELMEAARVDLAGSGRVGLQQLAMDKAWEAGLRRFETVAAKKFMLTDRNKFKQGVLKMGSSNPDELVSKLIGGQSPQFVRDVREIVGNDAMNDIASRYLDRNLKQAIKLDKYGAITNLADLSKNLGIDNPNSARFGVTKEMLRGTGVTPDMLQEFFKVARAAEKVNVPDASIFLSRRLVMGGMAGLGVLLGMAGPQHLVTGIAGTLIARQGAKIISNPENIRLATLALDANTDQAVRRSSIMRLYSILYDVADEPRPGEDEPRGEVTQLPSLPPGGRAPLPSR